MPGRAQAAQTCSTAHKSVSRRPDTTMSNCCGALATSAPSQSYWLLGTVAGAAGATGAAGASPEPVAGATGSSGAIGTL